MCNTFFQLKCIKIFGKTRLTNDERFVVIIGGELLNCWLSRSCAGAWRELLARWKSMAYASLFTTTKKPTPKGGLISSPNQVSASQCRTKDRTSQREVCTQNGCLSDHRCMCWRAFRKPHCLFLMWRRVPYQNSKLAVAHISRAPKSGRI